MGKLIGLVIGLAILFSGCAQAQIINPEQAQAELFAAWSANQHTIWELKWPAAPAAEVTVELWQAKPQLRLEILEAIAPALVGETLIFDGQTAWQHNRFDPQPPTAGPPALAPITAAFERINQLLAISPATATQTNEVLNQHPASKITLTFAQGDTLTFWRDESTSLPIQIIFTSGQQSGQLKARSFERLDNPLPGLFER